MNRLIQFAVVAVAFVTGTARAFPGGSDLGRTDRARDREMMQRESFERGREARDRPDRDHGMDHRDGGAAREASARAENAAREARIREAAETQARVERERQVADERARDRKGIEVPGTHVELRVSGDTGAPKDPPHPVDERGGKVEGTVRF